MKRPVELIDRVLHIIFGEGPYCEHGTTAWDGVCKDCMNDLYGPQSEESAEVIDITRAGT